MVHSELVPASFPSIVLLVLTLGRGSLLALFPCLCFCLLPLPMPLSVGEPQGQPCVLLFVLCTLTSTGVLLHDAPLLPEGDSRPPSWTPVQCLHVSMRHLPLAVLLWSQTEQICSGLNSSFTQTDHPSKLCHFGPGVPPDVSGYRAQRLWGFSLSSLSSVSAQSQSLPLLLSGCFPEAPVAFPSNGWDSLPMAGTPFQLSLPCARITTEPWWPCPSSQLSCSPAHPSGCERLIAFNSLSYGHRLAGSVSADGHLLSHWGSTSLGLAVHSLCGTDLQIFLASFLATPRHTALVTVRKDLSLHSTEAVSSSPAPRPAVSSCLPSACMHSTEAPKTVLSLPLFHTVPSRVRQW